MGVSCNPSAPFKIRFSEFRFAQIPLHLPPQGNMVTLQELLGARIRICIEENGYRTVEEFAFAFGIGKSTLSDILTGKKSPTVNTLARWANALGIPIATFFEDEQINVWVRETPPDYFHNREKPSGDPNTPRVPKKPARALKAQRRVRPQPGAVPDRSPDHPVGRTDGQARELKGPLSPPKARTSSTPSTKGPTRRQSRKTPVTPAGRKKAPASGTTKEPIKGTTRKKSGPRQRRT